MCVESQGGGKRGVVDDLYAAITRREEEVCAGPVEDALVCLHGLAVFGEDAQGGAVDREENVVLYKSAQWQWSAVIREADPPPCDNLVAVWCPCQCERLVLHFHLAHASLGPYVPEPDHAVRAAARQLVFVDWVEGYAFELCGRRYAWCAQLCRILDIRLLRVPYP